MKLDLICTYCYGAGEIIGRGVIGYWWWWLTGRAITQRCPECKGTGQQPHGGGDGQ